MPALAPTKNGPRKVRVAVAEFEAGATSLASLPAAESPEIAFAGRSNVGKSSLMNVILQRKGLVRTSRTPGCTRALNLFGVTLDDGSTYRMVDLPGYGYAKLSKAEIKRWGGMIEGYLRGRPTLRAVVLIVDVRRGLEKDDAELAEFIATCRGGGAALATIVVATKLDKLALSKRKPALAAFRKGTGVAPIGFSAVTAEGAEAVWERIRKATA